MFIKLQTRCIVDIKDSILTASDKRRNIIVDTRNDGKFKGVVDGFGAETFNLPNVSISFDNVTSIEMECDFFEFYMNEASKVEKNIENKALELINQSKEDLKEVFPSLSNVRFSIYKHFYGESFEYSISMYSNDKPIGSISFCELDEEHFETSHSMRDDEVLNFAGFISNLSENDTFVDNNCSEVFEDIILHYLSDLMEDYFEEIKKMNSKEEIPKIYIDEMNGFNQETQDHILEQINERVEEIENITVETILNEN